MAKDNLFLGTARGSVGDIVFSRLGGQQVARVRNRAPRNPQSPAQMIQRIIMSTVGKAYSFMSSICDHSFENFETGQLSQRKFMEMNVGLMRDVAAAAIAYPIESAVRASTASNFSFKNDYMPVYNRYMISAGSLPSMSLAPAAVGVSACLYFDPGEKTQANITYQDVVTALGIRKGDQLTFIQTTHNSSLSDHDLDLMTGFHVARIIMEPASGDMTTTFFSTQGAGVNDPNERNQGEFGTFSLVSTEQQKGLSFRLKEVEGAASVVNPDRQRCGCAVILSREINGRWLRSTQYLETWLANAVDLLNHSTLGLAYETYRINSASDLYLNQAD